MVAAKLAANGHARLGSPGSTEGPTAGRTTGPNQLGRSDGRPAPAADRPWPGGVVSAPIEGESPPRRRSWTASATTTTKWTSSRSGGQCQDDGGRAGGLEAVGTWPGLGSRRSSSTTDASSMRTNRSSIGHAPRAGDGQKHGRRRTAARPRSPRCSPCRRRPRSASSPTRRRAKVNLALASSNLTLTLTLMYM